MATTNEILDFDLPNVTNILTLYKKRLEELLKRNLTEKDNVATGNLLASIHTKLEIKDKVFEVWLNALKYLKYIESGTKAHWPPSKAILKWVQKKRLPTEELTGDKSLPTEKQLTFLISRAMAGKSPNQANLKNPTGGTYQYKTYSETIEQLNDEFIPRIKDALKKDVSAYLIAMEIHSELQMEIGFKL